MWQQLILTSNASHAEIISDTLQALGARAISFLSANDQEIFESKPGEQTLWQQTAVIALFTEDIALSQIIAELKTAIDPSWILKIHQETLADQDWERAWLKDFKPINIKNKLWIYPSWFDASTIHCAKVMLDPGLAFGSGTHPTTQLCLTFLAENIKGGETLVDYGCGSGILAIAALKLGAKKVIAIDHDPQALLASKQNAINNQINLNQIDIISDQQIQTIDEKFDIVIANILANPLIELAKPIQALLKPNGKLALSGILVNQQAEIEQAYQQKFHPTQLDQWLLLT